MKVSGSEVDGMRTHVEFGPEAMEGHVVMAHERAGVLLVVLGRLSVSVMLGTREHG